MNRSSRSCSKLCRSVVEHLGVTPNTMLATFLILAGLAALVMISNTACVPSVPATPPERTRPLPRPTHTLAPTATPTQAPTLLPPVTLEEPEDGSCSACQSGVTLRWICSYVLQGDEYYRVRLKGQNSPLYSCREKYLPLRGLPPGEYKWNVAIVRSTAQDKSEPVSEESDWYSFEILPPTPVVHSISPTSTVQGTSVPVVITGENFTRSLTLAIGVPLQANFVNSSTITATIPITLVVGQYPVTVKHSTGEGASYTSFTVNSKPPLSTIIPSRYPPPELTGVDILGSNVTFHWSWTRELDEDEYFALRVGSGAPAESKTWTKETPQSWAFTNPGDYVWEIAVCRGDPPTHDCEKLAVSDPGFFSLSAWTVEGFSH